jgi:ketosteroid isomerase-like protein
MNGTLFDSGLSGRLVESAGLEEPSIVKRLVPLISLTVLCFCIFTLLGHISFAGSKDRHAQELIALDDAWSKAAVARNVDQVASFYSLDAVAYPPNEPVAVGRVAAREVWARYFADPTYQVSWKSTSAEVENNLGWTAGIYEESFKGPDGKMATGKGKYLCVWRKSADGKWSAVQDMWNSDSK